MDGIKFLIGGYSINFASGATTSTLNIRNAHNIQVDAGTATINTILAGTVGYNKTGAGTLVLTNAGNTITGAVQVTGGVLELTSSAAVGGTAAGAGDITLNGGTFRNSSVAGTSHTLVTSNRNIIIGASGGTINSPNTTADPGIYEGSILGTGTLTATGPGELRVQNAGMASNTFTKLVVDEGLYRVGNVSGNNHETALGAAPGSALADAITLQNGGSIGSSFALTLHANRGITLGTGGGAVNTSSGTLTVPSVVTGAGSLTKGTTGTLTLSGNNDFSGGINFNDGRINFNHNSAAGSGTIAVGASADEFVSTASGIVLPNNVTLASGASPLIYATTGNSLKQTGQIIGAGGLRRTDTGGGTVTLAGDNNFAGGVQTTSRGLVLGHKNALGTGTFTIGDTSAAPTTAISVSAETNLSGGTAIPNAVTVNRDFTVSGSNDIEFAGPVTLATQTNSVITVSNSGVTKFSGGISGTGFGLTKAGAGTLVLSGTNTYTGTTSVNNGTLMAGGSLAGPVVVMGGTLAPGGSIGTLNLGGTLSLVSGTFENEFKTTPVLAGDLVNVDGDLNITAGVILSLVESGFGLLAPNTKFTMISYDDVWNGGVFTYLGDPLNDGELFTLGANTYKIDYDDPSVALGVNSGLGSGAFDTGVTLTVVPELTSVLGFGLTGLVAAAAVWYGRRRGCKVVEL
jgi:autotransporter-associated beta strand protein